MIQLSIRRRGFISKGSDSQPQPLLPHTEQTCIVQHQWQVITNCHTLKYKIIRFKDAKNINYKPAIFRFSSFRYFKVAAPQCISSWPHLVTCFPPDRCPQLFVVCYAIQSPSFHVQVSRCIVLNPQLSPDSKVLPALCSQSGHNIYTARFNS